MTPPVLVPVDVVEIELATAPRAIRPARRTPAARSARALVRLHGTPLGLVDLPFGPDGLSADACAALIRRALGAEIAAHERTTPGRADGGTEAIGVVIATRDRPTALARCLRSLAAMEPPAHEVIVVDNAPTTTAARELIARDFPHVRYLREERPGLAAAHNRGLAAVTTALVAFTDDDVTVDRLWLRELGAAFGRDPRIACATGLILPAELRTPAQVWAARHWGLEKGFREQLFARPLRRLSAETYPYTAGRFGSGANMAFRTGMLRELGGFDALMGAGTAARGGDDLAAFFEVIAAGHWILYTPAALVWHWYAEDPETLLRQAFGYGAGLSAYLTKIVADDPLRALDLVARAPAAVVHAGRLVRSRGAGDGRPPELRRLERRGMAIGPAAYLRGRRATRAGLA
jgi:GT2 family glycosyltransferase